MAIRRKVRVTTRPGNVNVLRVRRRRVGATTNVLQVIPAEEAAKRRLARGQADTKPSWPKRPLPKPRFDRGNPGPGPVWQHTSGHLPPKSLQNPQPAAEAGTSRAVSTRKTLFGLDPTP